MTTGAPLLDDNGQPFMIFSMQNHFDGSNVAGLIDGDNLFIDMRPDYFGFAGFRYQIADPDGATAYGSVELNINHVNQAPRSGEDRYPVRLGEPTIITVASLTANDYDIEGDAFHFTGIVDVDSGTAVYDAAAGTVTFTPAQLGNSTLKYRAHR